MIFMVLVNSINFFKEETYPNGELIFNENIERDIRLIVRSGSDFEIVTPDIKVDFTYKNDSSLIKLMFAKKYIDRINFNKKPVMLTINYMPYSRMDKVQCKHEMFSLKYVAEFINDLKFDSIAVWEPHSDVTCALLNNSFYIPTSSMICRGAMKYIKFDKENDYVMYPDAIAQKRYSSGNNKIHCKNMLVGYKYRNFETDKILKFEVLGDIEDSHKIIIVDDLCSYGETFIGLANAVKELAPNSKIYLVVTHLELSVFKGKLLEDDSPINCIFCTNTMASRKDYMHDKIIVMNPYEAARGDF